MSAINLDITRIRSINTNMSEATEKLIKRIFPEISSTLNVTKANILSTELNQTISTIVTQYEAVQDQLTKELPRLQEFIEQQMNSYALDKETTLQNLQSVLSRMNVLVHGVPLTFEAATLATGGTFGATESGSSKKEPAVKTNKSRALAKKIVKSKLIDEATANVLKVANTTWKRAAKIQKQLVSTLSNKKETSTTDSSSAKHSYGGGGGSF